MWGIDMKSHLVDVNVYLFSLATVLAFTNAFILNICNPLLVFMSRQTLEETNLEERRRALLNEQSGLNMVHQFAKYSKVQRQINAVDAELEQCRRNRSVKNLVKRIALQHGLKIFIGVVILFVTVYYRGVPVLILDERYNLQPFTAAISYPNGTLNAVSAHAWILCCTAFAELIKKA